MSDKTPDQLAAERLEELERRAVNWLRELAKLSAAKASRATHLPVCAADDPAASQVRAALERDGHQVDEAAGQLAVRLEACDEGQPLALYVGPALEEPAEKPAPALEEPAETVAPAASAKKARTRRKG